jgi:hypothetical protein
VGDYRHEGAVLFGHRDTEDQTRSDFGGKPRSTTHTSPRWGSGIGGFSAVELKKEGLRAQYEILIREWWEVDVPHAPQDLAGHRLLFLR